MKLKPCLILTSLSVLLCQVQVTNAQQPQPRFGYGSVPGGAYVIPAPKAAPRPAIPAKPAVKATTSPAAKAKTVAKTTPKTVPKATTKSPAKPTAAKPALAKAKAKPSPPKTTPLPKGSPAKAVASTKSKTKATAAPPPRASKTSSRTAIAQAAPRPAPKTTSLPAPARTAASSANRRPSPSRRAEAPGQSVPARQIVTVVPPSPSTNVSGSSNLSLNRNNKALLADITPAPEATGFHFFGVPVVLPGIPASVSTPDSSRHSFVDVLAARHSLGDAKNLHRYTKPETAMDGGARPAIAHLAPASLESSGPSPKDPSTTAGDAGISVDDLHTTRSVPASLALASVVPDAAEPALEATPLDEPALPAPVVSKALASPPIEVTAVSEEPLNLEPDLPREDPAPAAPDSSLVSTADHLAEEHDLSDRERAFVRSLAEAAGSVSSAGGSVNQDLPRSIATAASALREQVPAETITSFRSAAKTAKKTVEDLVPELPMEISNDLMPATPEKMPDRLPDFNAAPSGKIDVQSDRQADYDQANNKVIFTGKVELNSAAIRLRAERVEVFMKKGGGGMERVEATGSVLMRTQATENGPGQMASAGRASYNLKTGEITLSDWPKIQESGKSHISTDPSTKMFLFTDGRLRTDGPNRTLIGGAE